MGLKHIARQLRKHQTGEEKQLWRALRSRRFAGFRFRRQHVVGDYILDFYCADAKLAVELDGFQHGLPEGLQRDAQRDKFLAEQGIQTIHIWNHQWRRNSEGCLLDLWAEVQRLTGCVRVLREVEKQRFIPPSPDQIGFRDDPKDPAA